MKWEDIAKNHKPRSITRFQRILNGERDHMSGIDDGEWPNGERPVGYYEDYKCENPIIDRMSEEELATALSEYHIW